MKLAIVVPYRDRAEHLAVFLVEVTSFLFDLDMHVFVVRQEDQKPFNRGKLCNVGFSLLHPSYTHVVFHDVDLLPEDADYSPCDRPTQLCATASQFGPQGPPPDLFGGVTMFPMEQFRQVNGFDNNYWGWGAEDDDLLLRCKLHGLPVDRRPGRYRSLPHEPARSEPGFDFCYKQNYARLLAAQADGATLKGCGLHNLEHGPVKLSGLGCGVMVSVKL